MKAGLRSGKAGAWLLALGVAATGLGCPAFNQQNRDVDRTPITDVGTGATIIYPGQSPPVYQGAQHPLQTGQGSYGNPNAPGSASPGSTERRSVSGAPPARPASKLTMIGGTTTEQEVHISIDEKPVWWKYVTLPFAVVAAPIKYAVDAVSPEPEAGPEVPNLENAPAAPPPAPPAGDHSVRPLDYESRAIEQLERELEQRAPDSPATDDAFAAELARLRTEAQRPRQAAALPQVATSPPQVASTAPPRGSDAPRRPDPAEDPSLAAASGHVDRDGDGRTDHWIFREGGEIVRERFDEDFDGRPDRTLQYDLSTHQIRSIEEDSDHDGRRDTWTTLRDGAIVRRRTDTDGDGHVDTWSFYRDGRITRLDRDTDGDGFRDRVTRYEDGQLAREDEDDDADGRVETVRYYDAQERVSRLEEDTDHDGNIDLITHFQEGRLHRRELLDASALAPAPSITEHN